VLEACELRKLLINNFKRTFHSFGVLCRVGIFVFALKNSCEISVEFVLKTQHVSTVGCAVNMKQHLCAYHDAQQQQQEEAPKHFVAIKKRVHLEQQQQIFIIGKSCMCVCVCVLFVCLQVFTFSLPFSTSSSSMFDCFMAMLAGRPLKSHKLFTSDVEY